jgi:hypothetical protein
VLGRLDLAYNDFALPGDPHTSITTSTAAPGSATADRLALLASWEQTTHTAPAGRTPASPAAHPL